MSNLGSRPKLGKEQRSGAGLSCRLFIITTSLSKEIGIVTRRTHLRNPARKAEENRSSRPTGLSDEIQLQPHHPADSCPAQRRNGGGTGSHARECSRRRTHHGHP